MLITPRRGAHNVMAAIAGHRQAMIAATQIGLIEGVATVGIALALYPILKRQHPALALGYAGMRIAELAIAAVGVGLGGLFLRTLCATATSACNSQTVSSRFALLRR